LISRFSAEHPGNPDVTRISEGQTITCVATVANGGEGKATGVSIATPTWSGRGIATLVSHPSPASADIKGGENQTYTWTWQTNPGTAADSVTFSISVSGTDYNSSTTISTSGDSNSVMIQTPPKLSVSSKAEPTQISEGQDITITMTVTNEDLPETSQAAAMNVVPSELSLGGSTGHAALYSGPNPSSAIIKEGESQSFEWIYKTTTGNYGSVTFHGSVSGDDENSGESIQTAKMPSNLVLIQIPAALEISEIKAEPERISEEQQDITVTITVKNTGEATALGVLSEELTPEGVIDNIGEVKKTPIAKDIAGGKSETFKWVYETEQFQTIPNYEIDDKIIFTGIATGTDYNSGDKIPEAKNTSNLVVIQMPADLQVRMDLSTPKIFEGQSFQVKVIAHNVGETDAENVRSLEPEWFGTGKVSLVSSPKINPLIPGGGQHTFVWEYSTKEEESRGTVTFEGKVEGKDFNSKNPVESDFAESPEININVQPSRSMSLRPKITVDKVKVSAGQKLKITMTLTNERMIDVAVNVVPSLEITGTGDIARLKEIDIQPKRIEPEGTARYIWEYNTSENDVGIISFRGDASGKDEETGDTIGWFEKVESESVIVQRPAELISQISIQQKEISEGQIFTVTMTVTNESEVTVEEVKPLDWSTIGEGVVEPLFGPVPASIREILGGESHQYTWTYKAIREGDITFEGKASGNDANSGIGVESKITTSSSVIVRSLELESKIIVSPEKISEGQTLTVTMTVTNTGGAGAKEVVPSSLIILGKAETSGPKLESGPHPAKLDIPAGESKTYTWRYTTITGDAATVSFSGNVTGIDTNSGEEVPFHSTTSPEVTIQTPAHLVSQVGATPGQLSEGQIITVILTVENDGQATATNVAPSNPELIRGSLINAKPIKGPTPKSVDEFKTGAEQEFTWEYKTQRGDAGIVVFTANASGYDENSQLLPSWEGPGADRGRKVQSDKTLSNDMHIQIPAHLEVSLATSHQKISAGQPVDVTMTVKNIGQANALDVKPFLMILDNPVEAAPEPVISDILSGQSLKFQWTNIAITNEEEKIILKGQAEGIDENSNEPIESSSEVSVEIVQGPTLECELIANPEQISEGQDISVEMTVRNKGQVAAKNVVPELTIKGDGFAELIGDSPSNADIGEKENHTFELRYATTKGKSAGKITFEGKAKGVNELSSEIVASEVCLSDEIKIQQPAYLVITKIEAEPEQISEGQQITVRMEVKNEKLDGEKEQAEVDVTAPEKLVIDGTGKATLLPSNESQSAKIPGGGTYTFRWVYETTSDEPRSAGKIYFKAFVEGKDGNSDLSIKSNEMISNSVVIQRPATLKCTEAKIVEPQPDESGSYQVSEGQNIILGIKVTNTDGLVDENSTQAAATNVLPKVNTNIYETVTIEGSESPEPIILPAESTHSFTLIYINASLYDMGKEKGTGTIKFTVSATGFDANDSERDLSCPPVSLPVVTVVSRPDIEITKVEANKLQFSIGSEFQGNLDNNIIPEDLMQEFKNNGISLSENAVISIEEIGSSWLINDENKNYTIKKEENKLNIYTQLIGIEQTFDVIVSIENRMGAIAIIAPRPKDLSLPDRQYVIEPPDKIELKGGNSKLITYGSLIFGGKTEIVLAPLG